MTVPIIKPDDAFTFVFRWHVATEGYEWVRGYDGDPRLVVRRGHKGANSGIQVYSPLVKCRRLFLRFAKLKPGRADIQEFANRYGNLFTVGGTEMMVPRPKGVPLPRVEQFHGSALQVWKREIEVMRVLVEVWEAVKRVRKNELRTVIDWERKDAVWYKLGLSSTLLASSEYHKRILDRFKPFDVLSPARYLLQAEINKRIADLSRTTAIVPQLMWCPGPRINGVAKPDHHQRIVFMPDSLLAAMWLQFTQTVTEESKLRMCGGCGAYFQVGRGAHRSQKKTCSSKCRQRVSRRERSAKTLPLTDPLAVSGPRLGGC